MNFAIYLFVTLVTGLLLALMFGPGFYVSLILFILSSALFGDIFTRFGTIAYVAVSLIAFAIAFSFIVFNPPEGILSFSAGSSGRESRTIILGGAYTTDGRWYVFENLAIAFVVYMIGDFVRLFRRRR